MSTKNFCDICDKEITENNAIPTRFRFSHLVKGCNATENKNMILSAAITELSTDVNTSSKRIDVCKDCFKEMVGQM